MREIAQSRHRCPHTYKWPKTPNQAWTELETQPYALAVELIDRIAQQKDKNIPELIWHHWFDQ